MAFISRGDRSLRGGTRELEGQAERIEEWEDGGVEVQRAPERGSHALSTLEPSALTPRARTSHEQVTLVQDFSRNQIAMERELASKLQELATNLRGVTRF